MDSLVISRQHGRSDRLKRSSSTLGLKKVVVAADPRCRWCRSIERLKYFPVDLSFSPRILLFALWFFCASLGSARAWISASQSPSTTRQLYQPAGVWRGRSIGQRVSALLRNKYRALGSIPQMCTSSSKRNPESQQKEAESLWLGLDLSTQSLTGAVLRGRGQGGAFNEPVVLESVNFEVK